MATSNDTIMLHNTYNTPNATLKTYTKIFIYDHKIYENVLRCNLKIILETVSQRWNHKEAFRASDMDSDAFRVYLVCMAFLLY